MAKEARHDGYAYDKKYEATAEQKHRRAIRNRDRREALREGRVHKGDNKDVHHTNKGSLTGAKVVSSTKNRSWK